MKKIFKKLSCLFIMLLTVIGLTSCGENSIENFVLNYAKEDCSYEIIVTTNVTLPVESSTISTVQKDGNILYFPTQNGVSEYYIEVTETVTYQYIKVGEEWVKESIPNDDIMGEYDPSTLESEQFVTEGERGTYVVKDEYLQKYDCQSLTLSITDNSKTAYLHLEINSEEVQSKVDVDIKNYGKIHLTLPEVIE